MADTLFKLRILRAFLDETFTSWRDQLWDKDLDDRYCCDGNQCCCGGASIREMFSACYPRAAIAKATDGEG